jgi:ATP-binding cassette subfamily C (CFTR/MRP) protein 4
MYPDYMLWRALDDVELKDSINDSLGLDMHVAERGSNFSVGQRQLVCLARAILRSNKILMLDEATANVDPQTDSLIQRTIRTKFADCTVLTVAHRLNTIMDSDKVLVMELGTMVEFDHPHILLQNKEGHFYSMVQETGHTMAEQLSRISEECYHAKKKGT